MPARADIKEIIDGLRRDLAGPLAETCLLLLHRLMEMPKDQVERLTVPLLGRLAGRAPQDAVLQAAVTALTTVRHNPLTLYFVFLDVEDDREIPLLSSDIMQSIREDCFIHPRTGEPVRNFAELIQPVYRLSNEFSAVTEERRT